VGPVADKISEITHGLCRGLHRHIVTIGVMEEDL